MTVCNSLRFIETAVHQNTRQPPCTASTLVDTFDDSTRFVAAYEIMNIQHIKYKRNEK